MDDDDDCSSGSLVRLDVIASTGFILTLVSEFAMCTCNSSQSK